MCEKIAISTSWNDGRMESGKAVIEQIKSLGFEAVEIGAGLSTSFFEDIVKSCRELGVSIVSLHNITPGPPLGWYEFSCLEEEEFAKSIFFVKRTIRFAAECGAKAVVVHLGEVPIGNANKMILEEGVSLKEVLHQRELAKDVYFEQVLRALDIVLPYAEKYDVMLGIETRYHLQEIPSFEEIGLIMERYKGAPIGYWHDLGHGQVMEVLGVCKHLDFLREYKDYLIGMHIHDITGVQDHKPIGEGEFDFSSIKEYLKMPIIKVLEILWSPSPEGVRKSLNFLKELI